MQLRFLRYCWQPDASGDSAMKIIVRVPGSCGELVQGYWENQPFLVTCPIDWYTTVCVEDKKPPQLLCGKKAEKAVYQTLAYIGETAFPFALTLSSEIPQGKGMASSSADIGAVCIAVAAAFHKTLTAQEIAYLAASIEPTDGVFCPGIVAINYRSGRILQAYSSFPPLQLVIFDAGGTMNTETYHNQYDANEQLYGQENAAACAYLKRPYTAAAVGRAATCSAVLHQRVRYRPELPALQRIGKDYGSSGIVIGHSGTVAALLFPPAAEKQVRTASLASCVQEKTKMKLLGTAVLRSGGWQIEKRR